MPRKIASKEDVRTRVAELSGWQTTTRNDEAAESRGEDTGIGRYRRQLEAANRDKDRAHSDLGRPAHSPTPNLREDAMA